MLPHPRAIARSLLPLVTLLALIIAGCAANPQASSGSRTEPDLQMAADQTLRLQLSGEPKTIDPHRISFGTETSIARQLFSPLLWFDKDMNVIPWVASEIPSRENGGISADGLTYTYHLRQGLRWSDGKPLTAADFAWSFKRAMDPRIAGKYASLYFDVKGARELNSATKASDSEIEGLKAQVGVMAKDDQTLVVQLINPRASFLQLSALWVMYPVRQDVIERYGDKWTDPGNLVGNGPFVLKEWEHDQQITLSRNEQWFAPYGKTAQLQTVSYRIIPDDAVAWAAYLNDEIDVSRVPVANRREVLTDPKWKNHVLQAPEPATGALFFNNSFAPFDKKEVRQAFAMAVDRNAFVAVAQQGIGQPAYSWIPPMVPGHDEDLGKDIVGYNPQLAKQLLALAGYPDGKGLPEIKLTLRDVDANRTAVAPFLQEQLRKNLGVDLKTEFLDAKAYGSVFTGAQYQLAVASWHADYPDPDNWLPNLFGCLRYEGTKCAQFSGNNLVRYVNPRFDDLTRQATLEQDPHKRELLWAEAQAQMIKDVAIGPLYVREVLRVVRPTVKDLQYAALDSDIPGDHYLFSTFIAAN